MNIFCFECSDAREIFMRMLHGRESHPLAFWLLQSYYVYDMNGRNLKKFKLQVRCGMTIIILLLYLCVVIL